MQLFRSLVSRIESASLKRSLQMLTLLFVVVIVGLVSYTVVSLKRQSNDSMVINIAGRERMLGQKITQEFFLELERARTQGEKTDLSKLLATKKLFEVSLDALENGGQTYLDPAMKEPVSLVNATPAIAKQLQGVRTLWFAQQTLMSSIDSASYTVADLQNVSAQSATILKEMNAAVTMFTRDSEQRIAIMQRNQFIAAVMMILLSVTLSTIVGRSIFKAIRDALETTDKISSGNLERDGERVFRSNEMGLLAKNIDQMRVSLHDVINLVQKNSRQMAHSAQQVAEVSTEISSSSKVQRENSSEVITAINSLLETSHVVSDTIDQTAQISRNTLSTAQEGIVYVNHSIAELGKAVDSVNNASAQMQELKNFTQQINEITESIHTIAEQTNLLALNAAIEAARAGEQGRGFAVVADEVRNLAGRTSSSSRDISSLISQLTEKVENSVVSMQTVVDSVYQSQQTSEKTVAAFSSMSQGISETTESTATIYQFNQQQTQDLSCLDQKLQELFSVLKDSSDKAATTSMVAGDLNQISQQLESQISGFKTQQTQSVVKQHDDHRHTPRAANKLRATLIQGELKADGLSSDISMEGVKIRSTTKLDARQAVMLEFHLPEQIATPQVSRLTVKAQIVHSAAERDYYQYGLKFAALAGQQQTYLQQIFQYFKEAYRYQSA